MLWCFFCASRNRNCIQCSKTLRPFQSEGSWLWNDFVKLKQNHGRTYLKRVCKSHSKSGLINCYKKIHLLLTVSSKRPMMTKQELPLLRGASQYDFCAVAKFVNLGADYRHVSFTNGNLRVATQWNIITYKNVKFWQPSQQRGRSKCWSENMSLTSVTNFMCIDSITVSLGIRGNDKKPSVCIANRVPELLYSSLVEQWISNDAVKDPSYLGKFWYRQFWIYMKWLAAMSFMAQSWSLVFRCRPRMDLVNSKKRMIIFKLRPILRRIVFWDINFKNDWLRKIFVKKRLKLKKMRTMTVLSKWKSVSGRIFENSWLQQLVVSVTKMFQERSS